MGAGRSLAKDCSTVGAPRLQNGLILENWGMPIVGALPMVDTSPGSILLSLNPFYRLSWWAVVTRHESGQRLNPLTTQCLRLVTNPTQAVEGVLGQKDSDVNNPALVRAPYPDY
jgi:hypothetical protein